MCIYIYRERGGEPRGRVSEVPQRGEPPGPGPRSLYICRDPIVINKT